MNIDICKRLAANYSNMSNFYPFEVVDRASETQPQMVENVNKLLSRIGVNMGCHRMGQVCQYEFLGEGGHFHYCQAVSMVSRCQF